MILSNVKSRPQKTDFSCGPASLRSIFYYYGVSVSEKELIDFGNIGEEGTDFATMRKLANEYGFSFWSTYKGTIEDLKRWLNKKIPVLVCYQLGNPSGHNGHYSIVYGIDNKYIWLSDPSNYYEGDGKKFTENRKMTIKKFMKHWFEYDNGIKYQKWFSIIKLKNK